MALLPFLFSFFAASITAIAKPVVKTPQDITVRMRRDCFQQGNGNACHQLGMTLKLRGQKHLAEARAAFQRGCQLKHAKSCEQAAPAARSVASVPAPSGAMTDGLENGSTLRLQRVGADTYEVDRRYLKRYTANLNKGIAGSKLQPLGLDPERFADGYRFVEIGRDTIWRYLGFRNGDIFVEFNKTPVSNPKVLQKSLEDLRTVNKAVYTIKRGPREFKITFLIKGPAERIPASTER